MSQKAMKRMFMVSWERRRVLLHISPHTIEYLYEWKRTMNPPKRSQHTLTEILLLAMLAIEECHDRELKLG